MKILPIIIIGVGLLLIIAGGLLEYSQKFRNEIVHQWVKLDGNDLTENENSNFIAKIGAANLMFAGILIAIFGFVFLSTS